MNVGLILSGGMAKGAYQIGALYAIQEFLSFTDLKYISCSSVGTLNGYAFATQQLNTAESLWRSICEGKEQLFVTRVLRDKRFNNFMESLGTHSHTINGTLYTSLLDVKHRSVLYKNLSAIESSLIPSYLKASIAVPIIKSPIKINDEIYYDGAFVDNIPIYPLLPHEIDYIICIYFDPYCYTFENLNFDKKIIKLPFSENSCFSDSVFFKEKDISEMIEIGFNRTYNLLSNILKSGIDDLDYIYNSISEHNEVLNGSRANRKLRITGDVVATNINKLTSRFTKSEIK